MSGKKTSHSAGKSGGLIGFFEEHPLAWIGVAMAGVVGIGAIMASDGSLKMAQKIDEGQGQVSTANAASGIKMAALSASSHTGRGAVIKRPNATPATLKLGERLFKANCEVCHQADAIGKPGVAPSLINQELLSISSDKFLAGTIRDGREDTGMAPFAHLGRSKVQAIVEFLRSHQTAPDRAVEVDNQPDAHGDPRLGQQWYNNICSTCHGVAGDGYMAGGTGTAIGLKGFLNKATDGFIRETIKKGRSNTRMLGFQGPAAMANLSNQEIDDIIVYLRKQAKR
ncbi:MAG: c-type cytochrome [Hyphomicrobiaceae bacterium]|nr:c-type cytochrome [Hyphomicrobiaceae bacterium]